MKATGVWGVFNAHVKYDVEGKEKNYVKHFLCKENEDKKDFRLGVQEISQI